MGIETAQQRGFNLRLFLVATSIGAVGVLGYIPTLSATNQPLAVLGIFAVLMVIGSILGARFARPAGLGMPLVEAVLTGEETRPRVVSTFAQMAPVGIALGGFVAVMRRFVLNPLYVSALGVDLAAEELSVPLWAQLVGQPLIGGFTEEVVWRFGVMSVTVWLVAHFLTADGPQPRPIAAWSGIAVATAGFSLFHLVPLTTYGPLTVSVIGWTLALNAILGVILGWLYWKRGLEASIIVHVTTNIVAILTYQFPF